MNMAKRNPLVPQLKEQITEMSKLVMHQQRKYAKTRKEKITDLTQLKPGDHISFYKTDLYYAHHGIVCEARSDYLRVIHYFNTFENVCSSFIKGSIYIAEIVETEWPVNIDDKSEDIFLHHYDNIPCFSNDETLKRAFSQLGKRGYSLLGNNCEHWARWCRTDEHYSEQVYKFRGLIKEKTATMLIIDPTALLIKDIALVGSHTLGQFLSAVASGVILTTVESISTVIDIKTKMNDRRKGNLSNVALKKYIIRRISSASGTILGGSIGTVIGTILIPVPILGATIGGTMGSIGGKFLGGISGIALSKIVEVHRNNTEKQIKSMSILPKLMHNLSPDDKFIRSLINIHSDSNEDERISKLIDEALTGKPLTHYPSLKQIIETNSKINQETCEKATKLSDDFFSNSNSFDYFVLTPVPDNNSDEKFSSTIDLLILRWPIEQTKPWEYSNSEHILNINDLNE